METDVKGQLGGLEAAEGVRRRMAGESTGWRCGVCGGGKSNREILGECEERVRELGEKAEEVVVPEELKMGWRDEMEGKGKKGKEAEGEGSADGESDALAEGFVQTAPVLPSSSSSSAPVSGSAQQQQQTVPQPTRTVPSPSPLPVAAGPPLQQAQRMAADEGTAWLDRLIVAVAVLLAAVIAKVVFA